jgi:S-DNA-T family DNA segregation ATPase FtsK/SpoIIIE
MATAKKTRKRARLVESRTEALLRQRGVELTGLLMALAGLLIGATLWTYDPADPSLFSATGDSPRNALGLAGASLADVLHRAIGLAGYGLPTALVVWGARLGLHRGEHRAVSRMMTVPIAVALATPFASTQTPPAGWPHDYGLGGILGDAVLAELIGLVPLGTGGALIAVTFVLAALFLVGAGFALGVDRAEIATAWRFLRLGSVLGFAALVAALGIAGRAGVRGTATAMSAALSAAVAAHRRHRAAAAERAERASAGRAVRPEPVFGDAVGWQDPADGPDPVLAEDRDRRLKERITAAIRQREAQAGLPAAPVRVGPAGGIAADNHAVAYPDDADGAEGHGYDPAGAPPLPRTGPRVQHPDKRAPALSGRARDEAQPALDFDGDAAPPYRPPPLSLLANPGTIVRHHLSDDALEQNARMLESVLDDYGVKGEITSVRPGPVVTMYELEPAAGLKASRVIGLAEDIARSMSALAARVSTIPGRSVIGIELPNEHREKVLLREILSARVYGDSAHALPLALGKDIAGEPVVANLARMPHLLIAGTTGSGKSVAINTMILSLLYRLSPEDCRVIMIDPKMLELSVYDGIPHLLSPVVTDPKKAVVALKWVVAEMEERYRKMSRMGVRNIDGFNGRVREALAKGEAFTRTVQTGFDEDTGEPVFLTEEYAPETIPYIVVIVDEMADLMMVAGKEIEACIQRLAQMARASGIHLIMATQRPSVDVITGTIKANFPTRISFQVTSKIDSRTILGEQGAEMLLGQGDMLFMAGGGRITRVHGPFVSDEEVEEIVGYLKTLGVPEYVAGVVDGPDEDEEADIDAVLGLGGNTGSEDALYDQAVAIVARDRKCSTSYIQRKLAIGYNKAARLVEQMEDQGVVGRPNALGKREILVPER